MGEEQNSRAEHVFNLETAVFEQAQEAAAHDEVVGHGFGGGCQRM